MAFTSFTVRNTVSDNGSALRRTNVTQDSSTPNGSGDAVSDSGLRADDYFPPVPQEFLQSTFAANVYSRDSVKLNWEFGFTLISVSSLTQTSPVEVVIRASNYGEPVTVGDGDFVTKVTADNFFLEYIDYNTFYIKEGSWVYYSMFVKYQDTSGDGFYERVAVLSVQIPRNFNSTADLWKRIPEYYRGLDEQYALSESGYGYENGPLYRFIELFGWELDKFRTTIYDTMRINDPDVIHSSAIDDLAYQMGMEFGKDALGTAKLRAVLNNIGYLRRTKGTINSIEAYISALSGCGVTAEEDPGSGIMQFKVHPMRVNLFSDPFFNQGATSPGTTDTGTVQRVWADLDSSGREYGWGVYTTFSADPATDMTVSTSGDKLTITLPALSGTATVFIYSRGVFNYNNNLTYYYSAVSSHNFTPRFVTTTTRAVMEGTTPSYSYFDNWNDSVASFPVFQDSLTNGTRTIVASIPDDTTVASTAVHPVYKFVVTLSASSTTTLTFEKPLVEYKNSGGAFFSGDEPLGGFIQDPTASAGGGSYDYHWGQNAGSSPSTDFSYYTLDYHRSKEVVDNIVENYIVPVNVVKNTDYQIIWDVLE